MTPEQLLIKIKALDLLIDEVMETDACWDADKCASLLQDYLDKLKTRLTK
jgi:hypothetical protein